MPDETLKTVAEKLIACCREGREAEGLDTLYSDDAVSVEAADMGNGRECAGREAIKGKHAWWDASTEVHSFSADGPYFHGDDRFGVIFEADVTMKDSGERWQMKEVGIYSVADGKIVREEFFYAM